MRAVTVVITTFNLEKYIGRCLGGLYRQTMDDFDILVVDDASADSTPQIIEGWKVKFGKRLKTVYLKENLGLAALARNKALDSGLIHSEYVLFLDGDDLIGKHMVERLYQSAVRSRADISVCAYERVDVSNGKVFRAEMQGFAPYINMPPSDDTLAFVNTAPWNKLWKYDIISGLRYPGIKVGEEFTFNFQAYARCQRIAFIDDILIRYQVRKDSVISSTEEKMIWAFAEEVAEDYRKYAGAYKDVVGLAAFLHIGLSMGLRAMDNPEIDLKRHIKRIQTYFRVNYNWMEGNAFFKLPSLGRHGMKGVLLWCSFSAYRYGFFRMLLKAYKVLGRAFGIDMKF